MFGEQQVVSQGNKKEYIKYSKAIIKVKENNRVTKLVCNLPIHTDEISDLNTSYIVANHVISLYSGVLCNKAIITEVSIKMTGNRIVLYEVIGNRSLNLKKITFDTEIPLNKNMVGITM